MRKTVTREIEVKVCDECAKEQPYLYQCGLCRRELCNEHMAYQLEVFRYRDSERLAGYGSNICADCAIPARGSVPPGGLASIGSFLDAMLNQRERP